MFALFLPLLLRGANAQSVCNTQQPSLPGTYPPVLTTATIVNGDTTARQLFESIKADPAYGNVLNGGIAPKGNPNGSGDFSGDCWWTQGNCKTPKRSWLPVDYFTCSEGRTWGLSIDDGPNCNNDLLYSFLSSQNPPIKGTVFYIGSNVMAYPLAAQRGARDGHEICVHTWSHKTMTSLTDEQVFAELYYTKVAIHAATGITTKCWRPPQGDVDDRVRTWAFALGMRTILWDHDTFDYELDAGTPQSTIDNNYQGIYNAASDNNGVVVLQHELTDQTMGEFIRQYPNAAQHYHHFMPVTSCYNDTTPYVQTNITFPTFQQYLAGQRATPVTPFITNQLPVFATYDEDPTSGGTTSSSSTTTSQTTSSGSTSSNNSPTTSTTGGSTKPTNTAAGDHNNSAATNVVIARWAILASLAGLGLML
ncbi:carbohydrate esterase family 4 protein [Atractiella rhizophila]|nr:carbohydrate esterase family 4 protein [Atractiella rhizophila]